MARPSTPADRRDEIAADRDDAADRRDDSALGRDDAADRRDTEAVDRAQEARRDTDDLIERLVRIRRQVLGRLARIEDAALDRADWRDLTPAAFARLAARTAEQGRLAGLDREAVGAFLDDLDDAVGELRRGPLDAARDRRDAAGNRRESAGNRSDSGRDRDDAGRDREQAAVEREQADPRDLPPPGTAGSSRVERPSSAAMDEISATTARMIDSSRQRIAASRDGLTRTRRPTAPKDDDRPPRASDG